MNISKENYNSEVLVEMWAEFIDWDKRRIGENGFLLNTLKKFHCQNVFDACLGDGADSIYLLQNRFNVTSNDLDDLFIKKARENAKEYKVSLNITSYDWRDLDKYSDKNNFDAVICLGNSLTYLFKKEDQFKTLKNFRHLLNHKGILIIDERNYQYILDEKDEILKNRKFQYTGKYVYCGDKVHGKPIEISEDKVRFEYTNERTNKKGYLLLYPFKRGELLSLLRDTGFTRIEQYSDYKKGFTPNADFYQYVCEK